MKKNKENKVVKEKELPKLIDDYSKNMQENAGSRLMNEARNLMALANDWEKMGKAMATLKNTPRHTEALFVLKDATKHTVELINQHVSDNATGYFYGDKIKKRKK